MFASRGFASLALAYFRYDDLPEGFDLLELEYFEEAMEFLLAQARVVPDGCAVISISRGCEISLAMGILLDKVKAVVCISGLITAVFTTLMYHETTFSKSIMTLDRRSSLLDPQHNCK